MSNRRLLSLARRLATVALATVASPAPGAAQVSAGSERTFEVRIENVSRRALQLPGGRTAEIPLSPGVWAVHTGANPIFTPGAPDPGRGLKGLAEAGMAAAFAPNLLGLPGVRSVGVFDTPRGRPLRMMPAGVTEGGGANVSRMLRLGQRFEFTVTARPGERLSLALMVSQSNDGLLATGGEGIPLFGSDGRPVSGEVTAQLFLWDAGTEVNEEPGVGRNQGLRQGAPHAGDPERRPVRPLSEAEFGSIWPAPDRIVRITIKPAAAR